MNGPQQRRKAPNPVAFPITQRPDARPLMTSARAGRVYPAAFIPLMPEDAIVSSSGGASSVTINVNMEETEFLLSNSIKLRVRAHFVSYAALDRFDGTQDVAYAWAGREGSEPIVDTYNVDSNVKRAFYETFGEQFQSDEDVNTLYLRAYNQVINHERKLVSTSLEERSEGNHYLARSLWGQTAIARIVPTFDAALIEGEFELSGNVPSLSPLPIDDLGTATEAATGNSGDLVKFEPSPWDTTGDSRVLYARGRSGSHGVTANVDQLAQELSEGGFSVSLATLDQAKQLKSFAALRATYSGHEDELVDLLMRGIRMPDTMYRDPILIASGMADIGYNQRYATDAANLDTYVANGVTQITLPLRLPTQPTGGCVVITYDIVPDPVFDRQADMFLRKTFEEMPNALRDHLDIQKVDVVPNKFVDSLHSSPDETFGYAPMNYDWSRKRVGVGGRFLRTLGIDASAEDQQHIWSVRTVNPELDEDAFLVPEDLAHNVFLDTTSDPFIVRCSHSVNIAGITQFGPALFEGQGDYDATVSVIDDNIRVDPNA